MKLYEINKRYTEIVMEYINNGYYFNTTTMSGSQGEIAHSDLTDGKTIVRIVMDDFNDYRTYSQGIRIIVGKCADECTKPNDTRQGTIWNSELEIISSETFYQIGRENRSGGKFYGTEEEATAALQKIHERNKARRENDIHEFTDKAKAIVISYIRRQPKCKSAKIADIGRVYKISNAYYVTAKGKTYRLK